MCVWAAEKAYGLVQTTTAIDQALLFDDRDVKAHKVLVNAW